MHHFLQTILHVSYENHYTTYWTWHILGQYQLIFHFIIPYNFSSFFGAYFPLIVLACWLDVGGVNWELGHTSV